MPSQTTAKTEKKTEVLKCEVLKAVGIDATPEAIKHLERRAKSKGLKFSKQGLTTTVYPAKPVYSKEKKDFLPGEPVYLELEVDIARKLQNAGAVRVVI